MKATVMYGAHDVRVETVPDARLVEPIPRCTVMSTGEFTGEMSHD